MKKKFEIFSHAIAYNLQIENNFIMKNNVSCAWNNMVKLNINTNEYISLQIDRYEQHNNIYPFSYYLSISAND